MSTAATGSLTSSHAPAPAGRRLSRAPATIAFVHRGANWITGAEQCVLDLVSRLDRTRFRSVVICSAPALAIECENIGVEAHQYPEWSDWERDGQPRSVSFARLRGILRDVRPSLVHANMTTPIPGIVPEVRRQRIPMVAHLHMPLENRYKRLHEFIHQASAAVGVAEHVIRPLAEDGLGPDRLRLIYNAVDAERLAGGDATGLRAELGIPASALVALSVGSLIVRKAHDVTIRAVARARATGADVRLLVCGTGSEEAKFRALVAELGIGDAVHFLGYRGDIGAIQRDAADVLAASAREEALPLNVLEAQWQGLTVVASDIPAHHEAIDPGRTGVLVPVEDHEALARALVQLAADPAARAAYGEAGRAFARERFSMDRYVGAFDELYTELLARPRSAYGWVRGSVWPRAYTRWVSRAVGLRLHLVRPELTPE